MRYKKGDRILADDANKWNDNLQSSAYRPAMFQESAPTLPPDKDNHGRVVIEPVQAMAAYSLMKGQAILGIHATSGRPRFSVSNTQDQAVIDGSNNFYFTCGKVPLPAGGSGFGEQLKEGEYYWLRADETLVAGYCGLAINGSVLSQWYPGFIAIETKTVDGVSLALATPMANLGQNYKVKTVVDMTSNTFSRCTMCKPVAGGWTDTSLQVDVWQAFSGTTASGRYLYCSYVNGRLVNFLESCTS